MSDPAAGAGSSVGAVLGPAAMLVSPFILGPPLVSLLTGNKTLEDMMAEQAARDAEVLYWKEQVAKEQELNARAEALKVTVDPDYEPELSAMAGGTKPGQ